MPTPNVGYLMDRGSFPPNEVLLFQPTRVSGGKVFIQSFCAVLGETWETIVGPAVEVSSGLGLPITEGLSGASLNNLWAVGNASDHGGCQSALYDPPEWAGVDEF